MPLSNVVKNKVLKKINHKSGDVNDSTKLVSVRLLKAGSVSEIMMNEKSKAIKHSKKDSVKN